MSEEDAMAKHDKHAQHESSSGARRPPAEWAVTIGSLTKFEARAWAARLAAQGAVRDRSLDHYVNEHTLVMVTAATYARGLHRAVDALHGWAVRAENLGNEIDIVADATGRALSRPEQRALQHLTHVIRELNAAAAQLDAQVSGAAMTSAATSSRRHDTTTKVESKP
jgi:hypothetical protein